MQQLETHFNPHTAELVLNNKDTFAAKVVRGSWWLFLIAVIIQCVFFWSMENIVCICACIFGWTILTRVFLQQSMLLKFPFSSFIIIGFVASELYLPLIFMTLEGKSMVFNLELPEQVFLHSVACLLVLTMAHAVYRFFWRISFTRSHSLLEKVGFFDAPSILQLWLLGGFGMIAQWYVFFIYPDIGREITGDATDKLIQALIPFSYAPFFIPFGKLFGNNQIPSKKLYPLLLAYTIMLFAVSIGRNSRGSFMYGFTAIAFTYGLGLLMGVYKSKIFTLRNGIIAGVALWMLTGPMADLGTAMVIVRYEREAISAQELIGLTLEAYQDKEAIRAQRLDDKLEGSANDWDEPYLDNIFAARFANIKFSDMTLIQYEKLGQHDPDMFDYTIDHILCSLPEPFMKILNIDADKEAVYSVSFGDYIYLLAGGSGFPNGFRTGHLAGTGMAAFGWWYLGLLGAGMVPIFFLFDKFYKRKSSRAAASNSTYTLQFSLCGLLAITSIWQFLPKESVAGLATFLIRGWIQLAVLYLVLFHLTRLITRILIRDRHHILPSTPIHVVN